MDFGQALTELKNGNKVKSMMIGINISMQIILICTSLQ